MIAKRDSFIHFENKEVIQPDISIPVEGCQLKGDLILPEDASGLVLFAHGSGSSRKSPRNQFVAETIRQLGLGTLLFDLLTSVEEQEDFSTYNLRFNIPFLAERLVEMTHWVQSHQSIPRNLPLGYFGSSTGAAAALSAAAHLGERITTVVSRGGRPDLTPEHLLKNLTASCLFLVGEFDHQVLELNLKVHRALQVEKSFIVIPGATHLFQEPGALEQVASVAAEWFHLKFCEDLGAAPSEQPRDQEDQHHLHH
jgi:putative phosphoribosyl transferase